MESINLLELYDKGIVKDGAHNVNVPIRKANGEKYRGKTYAIPLKYLYYNEQNGRIGVALSEYESEHGKVIPGQNEEYNMIMQGILIDENDGKTKKDMNDLKRDMAKKGQQEAGYVLNDGRVIDGNRRLTAKRLLDQDSGITEPQYYEAVILDDLSVQNHDDQKSIKSLELQIQFGKLGKVDYNAIDRAIDAYKTISVNNIMSVKEYADYAGLKPSEVDNRILEAELVVKFLEFVNTSPDNYALAKKLDLDGPLQNLISKYKKIKKQDNAEQLLNTLFVKILQIRQTGEDFKKDYRDVVTNVIGTRKEEEFVREAEDATDAIVDALGKKDFIKNSFELSLTLSKDKDAANALAEVQTQYNYYSETAKNNKERKTPEKLVNKAITSISSVDTSIVGVLPKNEKNKLFEALDRLEDYIAEIRSAGV